jgi:hypothetical protein
MLYDAGVGAKCIQHAFGDLRYFWHPFTTDSSAPASGSVQKKPAAMRPNYQSYRKAKKNRGDGKSPRVELNLPA